MRRAIVAVGLAGVLLAGAAPATGTFPGRNGKIVFSSARAIPGQPHADSGNAEIYALDLLTGKRKNLTRNARHDYAGVWSPDGRFIAFVRGENTDGGDIWVMQADGRGQHRVGTGPALTPAWSPDGSTLAF